MPKKNRGGKRNPPVSQAGTQPPQISIAIQQAQPQSQQQQVVNQPQVGQRAKQDCVADLKKLGVRVDQSLLNSATDKEMNGITESIEFIESEFPRMRNIPDASGGSKTRNALKILAADNLKPNVMGNASMYGEINFAKAYLGSHGGQRGVASHETGHMLERAIILMHEKSLLGCARAWNKCTYATQILHEACSNLKKGAYKGQGMTNNAFIGQVSQYALTNRSEALAECVKDYCKNGANSKPVSIEVWKILKRELG